VVIHQRLRDAAAMAGEVDVLGSVDRLEVWNHDRLAARMLGEPFTDDDAKALSEFGI
jgi:DNA-binding transcriptional regulator/RsmH inhibitor MraZ